MSSYRRESGNNTKTYKDQQNKSYRPVSVETPVVPAHRTVSHLRRAATISPILLTHITSSSRSPSTPVVRRSPSSPSRMSRSATSLGGSKNKKTDSKNKNKKQTKKPNKKRHNKTYV
jgi:hypothetical protein